METTTQVRIAGLGVELVAIVVTLVVNSPPFWLLGVMFVVGLGLIFNGLVHRIYKKVCPNFFKVLATIRLQRPWPFYRSDKPYIRGVPLENLVHVFDVEIDFRELESTGHLKFILHGYNATPYALKFRSEDSRIGLFQAELSGGVTLGPFALEPITKHPVPPYSEFMLRLVQGIPKDCREGILEFIRGKNNSKNIAPPICSLGKVKIFADVEGREKISFSIKMNDHCEVGLKHRKPMVGTTCIRHLHPKNLNVQPKITSAKNE